MQNQSDTPTVDKVEEGCKYLVPTLKSRSSGVVSLRVSHETKQFYHEVSKAAARKGFKFSVDEMLLDILTEIANSLEKK